METTQRPGTARLLWPLVAVLGALIVAVVVATWWRASPGGAEFLEAYPGTVALPETAPVGIPAWLGWQHFLNFFFIVLVIRSGFEYRKVKASRPSAFWWSKRTREGQRPNRIGVELWFHLALDLLWFINGVVFIVLLILTGQWMRIVPTSWEILPNAVSVAVQYLSFDWPTESSWVSYNALQLLAYFVTVFIAAPLAAITGYRLSYFWPQQNEKLARLMPFDPTLKLHFGVMIYFVIFIVVHVVSVFATGALRNLNHMFAANDGEGWAGAIVFAGALAVVIAAWLLARPAFIKRLAAVFGNVR